MILFHEELEYLRGISRSSLMQSYTLQKMMGSTTDDYFNESVTPDPDQVSIWPCYYEPSGKRELTEVGWIIRETPVLYVLPSDPVVIGDQVSNFRDEDEQSLDSGPYKVRAVVWGGGLMNAWRRVDLEQVTRAKR